jgi:multisubunit Na+/H+ antiporter MnhB subunit
MAVCLCAFVLLSFFEIRSLFKRKEKTEAVLFIIIGALAVSLGVFLLMTPDFTSFSKIMLDLFNIG